MYNIPAQPSLALACSASSCCRPLPLAEQPSARVAAPVSATMALGRPVPLLLLALCVMVLSPATPHAQAPAQPPRCAWASPTLGTVDLTALQLVGSAVPKCWGGGMLPPSCLKNIPYMPGCLPPGNLPHLYTFYNLCAGAADAGGMGSSCVDGTAVCTCDGPSGCSAGILYGHGNLTTSVWSDFKNGSDHGVQIDYPKGGSSVGGTAARAIFVCDPTVKSPERGSMAGACGPDGAPLVTISMRTALACGSHDGTR